MKKSSLRFLIFCSAAPVYCGNSYAVTPLSQYGQIQNVQNYSSSPFWSPGSQYNKRIAPSPVYATGPDVETVDCQNIVFNLVSAQCAAQNKCTNMRVADIRPAVMTGLARLPGHNYASACAGYIDSAFESYINQYTNTVQSANFPTATGAATSQNKNEFKINNPYEIKTPAWADGARERAAELEQLQSQNGAGSEHVARADFPTTINDVSFADRMENLAAGYAPYRDASAYASIKIEPWEKTIERELITLNDQLQQDTVQLSPAEYCDKYFDEERCPADQGHEQDYIAMASNPNKPETHAATTPTSTTTTPEPQQTHPTPVTPPANRPNQTPAMQQPTTTTVVANNRIHDGPCTPSARSNHFQNKILTSGKYETIDPAFEKMMVQIFRVEGGCGNHPNDSGGYTCYGYAQNSNPDIDVRKLTRAGAEDRTYQRFYKAKGIDRLPDAVRGDVLRGDFGSGPGVGIKKLQKTLGLKQTGNVDDTLIRAAENYNGDLHQAYWDTIQDFYVDIVRRNPKRKVFLKGWMNSIKLFRDNGCHVVPDQPLTR